MRKNNCKDCYQCGVCSDSRCRFCQTGSECKGKSKMTMQEQIEKFEEINKVK